MGPRERQSGGRGDPGQQWLPYWMCGGGFVLGGLLTRAFDLPWWMIVAVGGGTMLLALIGTMIDIALWAWRQARDGSEGP